GLPNLTNKRYFNSVGVNWPAGGEGSTVSDGVGSCGVGPGASVGVTASGVVVGSATGIGVAAGPHAAIANRNMDTSTTHALRLIITVPPAQHLLPYYAMILY